MSVLSGALLIAAETEESNSVHNALSVAKKKNH